MQPLNFAGFPSFWGCGHFPAEGGRFSHLESSPLAVLGIRNVQNWAFGWRGGPPRGAVNINTFEVENRKGRFRLDETLIF